MRLAEVRSQLEAAGFTITSEKRLPDNFGVQMRLANDAIVNVYDSGAVTFGGKNAAPVEAAHKEAAAREAERAGGWLARSLSES